MAFFIQLSYLLALLTIGTYIYFWSSTFKKLGSSTVEELNEGEEKVEDLVNEGEARMINYFGSSVFLLIGSLIWVHLGIAIGQFALDISDNRIVRYFGYFFMYFIFLKFPFGVGNKMVKRSYDFKHFPEKIWFALLMIASYIFSICCYDMIPSFLKWHLSLLN
ncbi:MAG: hypothetical protein AAF502_04775 [Bacteroidota bacterium]